MNIHIQTTGNTLASHRQRLIVFTRYPEPGTTKTRLIPVLGREGAADLQRKMTEHTLSRIGRWSTSFESTIEIRFVGGSKDLMQDWLGPDFIYELQGKGNLGHRMCKAFEASFNTCVKRTVIIGTDIPEIDESIIREAFGLLKQQDMVLGPAKDGGYYLIGLCKDIKAEAVSELFYGIPWGTDTVLEDSVVVASCLGLTFSFLKTLADIDTPEDIPVWRQASLQSLSRFPGSVR